MDRCTHEPKAGRPSGDPVDLLDGSVRLAAMANMASTLVHEVSQPLTAATNYITACALLLKRQEGVSEELLRMTEYAAQEATKAIEIIRHMRKFIVSGKVEGRPERLRTMIDNVISAGLPKACEVEIVCEVPLDHCVLVDRVQIEQVLTNIIINACEAIGEAQIRRITISSARRGDEIVTEIIDTGPGLSEPALARAFDPLFTTKTTGMGLGMAISKGIIEAHGGRLWVENAPGGGARFSFSLPWAESAGYWRDTAK